MSIYKELSYDNETDLVRRIQFSVMSPEEIRNRSVVEVTKNEVFVGADPVPNGLFDLRMGVIDHNKICHTCQQKNTFCPGHFGHIDLGKPVFYIQFLKYVEKLLKCICFRCSRALVDRAMPEVAAILSKKISLQKRWELISKLCTKSKKVCGANNPPPGCGAYNTSGCGARQPDRIAREGVIKIGMEWKEKESKTAQAGGDADAQKLLLSAEDVLRILRRMTDDDIDMLGFSSKHNRPEWMICSVLPVPPPSVRPSVRTEIGQRSEDDLTHKLTNIIKANNTLKAKIEKGVKEQIDICTQLLQYEVATLIDNQIPGIPPAQQRTGRPLRSLSERLKSKEGRIRGNLMGKRVDFSARSVITPDPCISIDELGCACENRNEFDLPRSCQSL
jgi:DNA-directed RNA polymerase II subunit RPB1